MLQVHAVFKQFDDGKNEVGVAQPAEYVVEDTQVLVLHALGYAMAEGCQHHAMNVRKLRLHGSCHVEGVVVSIARHANHQVYACCLEHGLGFLCGRHLYEHGRVAQPQAHILIIYLLLHAPVVFQHKGIVGVCHDEYIIYTAHHQVDERYVFQVELIPFGRL